MNIEPFIQLIAIGAIPILFAITLHEAAHGYVARYFGDSTAERAGRISLNPIRHIDPVGTVLLPILTLWVSSMMGGGMLFGWAKPVPVNFGALRHPKRDMLWVALAGPASNLLMAFAWAIIAKWAAGTSGYFAAPLLQMANLGVTINVILIALNMLPLPPLDGGRIAVSLLPYRLAAMLSRVEPFGFFILIFLAMTNILWAILMPIMSALMQFLRFFV
jgi:Zn-dependent protease